MSHLARVRALNQLLHRPRSSSHSSDIARAICGAQAQDPRHGRLAFRARSATLTAAAVTRAREEERSLLLCWVMRNTLHLIASEDAHWLLPLYEERWAANGRRRLGQLGVSANEQAKALRIARRALAGGALSRSRLRERIAAKGIELRGYAAGHVIGLVVTSGIACLGPGEGPAQLLVPAEDWLGKRGRHDRDRALAELARRYLRAFGPSSERDFAKWAGLPLREVRQGLSLIAGELRGLDVAGEELLVLRRAPRRAMAPVLRLLPAWDTFWMGYRDRQFAAPGDRWTTVSDGGGMIAPAVVADGTAIARWRPPRKDEERGAITHWFERPSAAARKAVDAELADIARFETRNAGMAGRGRGRQGVHTARATPARR